MRNYLHVLLLLTAAALLSCGKDEAPEDPMTVGKAVLVYMAANNDLSSYTADDYAQMLGGYLPEWYESGDGDVLLVYLHLKNRTPKLLRLYSLNGAACADTLINYPLQNSCEDTTFRKVLRDAFGTYDSSERGLIVSSHATGWLPDGYYSDPIEYAPAQSQAYPVCGGAADRGDGFVHYQLPEDPYSWMVKGIGYDSFGNHEMEMDVFCDALGYHLDYVLFDCCLMGGVETAYQIKDKADYVVFSQTEILADGFPYSDVMSIAFRKGIGVQDRAAAMAELYFKYYDTQSVESYRSATISVVKTSGLEALATAVRQVMDAGGTENTDTLGCSGSVLKSVQRYFRYSRHWFYDLDDYICHVCPSSSLYADFSAALDRAVIYKAATPSFLKEQGGFDIVHFSGLSTYIDRPKNSYLEDYYRKLKWGAAILPR